MTLDLSPTAVASSLEPVDLKARAQADGVRFLLALFVDLTGKQCAKLVPVEAADELQHEGVGFAGYAVGAIGQQPSDPDLIAIPDVESYTPLPRVRPDLALVHCDPHVEGRAWPFAPRVILKAVIADAARQGWSCSRAPRWSTSWSRGGRTARSRPPTPRTSRPDPATTPAASRGCTST
jgi:glutamine synthetase